MPPMACAPRRWQVLMRSCAYARRNGASIVTCPRSGSTNDRIVPQRLDRAENVVPPAAVQAGAVLLQLEEDLVHLERGRQRLDEHRRLDRARAECSARCWAWTKTSFQSRASRWLSHLRQVEVRAGARVLPAPRRCGRSTCRSRTACRASGGRRRRSGARGDGSRADGPSASRAAGSSA